MRGLGTLINAGLVVLGSGLGVLIGDRIPEQMRITLLQVIGLVTIALGVSDAIDTRNMVFPLVGMAVGALIGELLAIESRLERLGERLQRRFARDAGGDGGEGKFVKGFVTASALYCIGPLTVLGAIEDASGQTPQLYIIKGSLDGFVSIMFAAMYGIGVAFSALSVLVVQGSLTLGGAGLDAVLDDRMRTELFAAGGIAVIGIGLNLLQVTKIRLANLLPGLVVTPVLVAIFAV
ncbi:MAG: hypothetical protein ABR58_03765 [Acidimicrobium sp. BACL19 MAG-120924-bin39]|nr:MAG: hypothetical protein ABR58_03765 [Acidimicrobium sp. BACL19 MAG-120924-bin39]